MSLPVSVYLDLLRFSAAVLVFLFHIGFYSGARVPVIGNLGSEAVMVFFVLSGFVIAYTTSRRHSTIIDYGVARLSRLWSVMLPALCITVVLDTVGQYWNQGVYEPLQPYTAIKWLASLFLNLTFTSQIWQLKVWPGSNGPFWSISYEFWFYALFAAGFYFNGWKKILGCGACVLIAGPKIMVTFPLWYMGVWAYRAHIHKQQAPQWLGWLLWVGSVLLAILYFTMGGAPYLESKFPGVAKLAATQWRVNFWPESYFLGVLIALNIYGFGVIGGLLEGQLKNRANQIKTIADTSFGLYLFHIPFLFFFKAFLIPLRSSNEYIYVAIMYICTFSVSLAMARYCERSKSIIAHCLRNVMNKLHRNSK